VPEDPVSAWHVFTDTPPPRGPSLFERIVQRPPPTRGALTLELHGRTQTLPLDASMLARGLLIGRDERCDVVVPDGYASRVHAVMLELDERLWLIDTGSSNGTWLQAGLRVNCHALQDGDAWWIGRALVRWRALH
jgi:predicted component of type VI protein secretion system